MINELVTEREWHHLYPEVDQEYVWEYPLFRGESEPGKNLFESQDTPRSEERRVGKECRSRWSPYH